MPNVVPEPGFGEPEKERLAAYLRSTLEDRVDVSIALVSDVAGSPTGKAIRVGQRIAAVGRAGEGS